MAEFNVQVMLKSGKTYVISPCWGPDKSCEDSAREIAENISNYIREGKTFYTLVTGDTSKFSSFIRLDSVETIWVGRVTTETEEEKKKREAEEKRRATIDRLNELYVRYYEDLEKRLAERRPVDDRLTQLQIEHYEIINQGEDWKKGERGF